MAVRGVYNDLEKEIIEQFNQEAEKRCGWSEAGMMAGGNPTVTLETLLKNAHDVDAWNPLWNLEKYAAATRWGGIIAHPFFAELYKPEERMVRTKKGLFLTFYLMGHDFINYQPVRPGDILRAYAKKPTLVDNTDLNGKGPRKFRYQETCCDVINQRNEIVTSYELFVEVQLHEGVPPQDKYLPEYGYTEKEINYLADLVQKEKPRGRGILYWEDIKEGDSLGSITTGPTDFIGMNFPDMTPPGEVPKRSMPRYEEPLQGPVMTAYVPDRETGLIYPVHGGRHTNDRAAQYEGGPRAWIFNFVSRYPMCRLVTNWIGDDGFVCKFSWRHIWRTPVGDSLIINGKVARKYIENGEHLVDVKAWCLNLRGSITDVSTATVKLLSKDEDYPPVKTIINR